MASKISKYSSEEIAKKIANKAFEHLYAPLYAEEEKIALKVYVAFTNQFDTEQLKAMEKAGLLSETDRLYLNLLSESGQEIFVHSHSKGGSYFKKNGWGFIEWTDDDLHDQAQDIKRRQHILDNKASELHREIQKQCQGKAPNTVIKAWPEAESIIQEILGTGNSALTTPLENLLARFLPMLPAPTIEST